MVFADSSIASLSLLNCWRIDCVSWNDACIEGVVVWIFLKIGTYSLVSFFPSN